MAPALDDDPTPALHPSPHVRSDHPPVNPPADETSASEDPHQPKKTPFMRRPRVVVSLLIFFTLVLTLATAFGIIYLLLGPKYPYLAISSVSVTHPESTHPRFVVSMKTKNPNNRVGVSYEDGGRAVLSFKKNRVASGPFPSFMQGYKSSETVHMVLKAANRTMPPEVRNSILNVTSQDPLSLGLAMNVSVRMKILGTKMWIEQLMFNCQFRIDTLANSSRILSQKCPVTAITKWRWPLCRLAAIVTMTIATLSLILCFTPASYILLSLAPQASMQDISSHAAGS